MTTSVGTLGSVSLMAMREWDRTKTNGPEMGVCRKSFPYMVSRADNRSDRRLAELKYSQLMTGLDIVQLQGCSAWSITKVSLGEFASTCWYAAIIVLGRALSQLLVDLLSSITLMIPRRHLLVWDSRWRGYEATPIVQPRGTHPSVSSSRTLSNTDR